MVGWPHFLVFRRLRARLYPRSSLTRPRVFENIGFVIFEFGLLDGYSETAGSFDALPVPSIVSRHGACVPSCVHSRPCGKGSERIECCGAIGDSNHDGEAEHNLHVKICRP